MTDILFYDSAYRKFPKGAEYVCEYRDGDYATTTIHYPYTRWITVMGGAEVAATAGIADYEPDNWVYSRPGALRAWAAHRKVMGKRARVYCDRANARQAAEQVAGLPVLWWIATLDERVWTAAELAADLKANWGAGIAEDTIWANQYADVGGDFDVSRLYLPW